MALTEDQRTAIEAAKTRLQAKYTEINNIRYEIREVQACADRILEDTPTEPGLNTNMTDARIEEWRAHVISKADMLAPSN